MSNPLSRTIAVVLLGLMAVTAQAAPPLTEAQLANKIDSLFAARWKKENIVPAPLTDDAAFIRRVFLDLAGRIPNILEIRDFLDDDRPDKRRIWVDRLLVGGKNVDDRELVNNYNRHFAVIWGEAIVPPGASEDRNPVLSYGFQAWMKENLRDNVPYDEIVRRIFAGSQSGSADASSFYQVNENKPENLAAAASRLFLGVKLECSQCHDDRSGGPWSREQFWEMAAFFTPGGSLEIPGKKQVVKSRFLDGKEPKSGGEASVGGLSKWVTSPQNSWFARNAVNRLWAYLFGIGIVDPVDEFGSHNEPSHPEVLDLLAEQFVAHKFDLKYVIRTLVLTELYQRGSETTHTSQDTPRSFARMAVRGLSAGQLFDSLAEAMEYKVDRGATNLSGDPSRSLNPREDFIARFYNQDKTTEMQTSILQALYLMNGKVTARAISLEHNRTLQTISEAVKQDSAGRIERLYLVALTRKPTEKELKRLIPYVDKGGPTGDRKKALADIFWALLNSGEFRLNH